MKQVILLHNPSAGDENHLKEELVNAIENEGFTCTYFSIREDEWKQQLDNADFAVIGGGDGTIRKVVKELVGRTVLDKRLPMALLPMGTANNLSKTLGISRNQPREVQIKAWKEFNLQKFDVGVVKNADATTFFLESVGFGSFPKLMKEMDVIDKSHIKTAKDELKLALSEFYKVIESAETEKSWIKADDTIIEGDFLLIEIMNNRSIGPNLVLAAQARIDDGVFEIVLVEENQRSDFLRYIQKLIDGKDAVFTTKSIKAKNIVIANYSKFMHIDDELIIPMKNPISIEIRENILEFFV